MTAKAFEIQVQDDHLERITQTRNPSSPWPNGSGTLSMRTPSITDEQQAILALHRMRQQLVNLRTAQINGLRDPADRVWRGHAGIISVIGPALERIAERLPATGWTAHTLRASQRVTLPIPKNVPVLPRGHDLACLLARG